MTVATGSGSSRRSARLLGFASIGALVCLGLPFLGATTSQAQQPTKPQPVTCTGTDQTPGTLPRQAITIKTNGGAVDDSQPDLVVTGTCNVRAGGDYFYAKVNITTNGKLIFKEGLATDTDKVTNFWARSIIIENQGAMKAGVDADKPYGTNLHTLNIILYGKDQGVGGKGDTCLTTGADLADCGVPKTTVWDTNGGTPVQMPGANSTDFFYQYGTMHGDGGEKTAHYGYKVLAVGYGGTLQLRGLKGTTGGAAADLKTVGANWTLAQAQTETGSSWARLAKDLAATTSGGAALTLDRPVEGDWQPGDKIVVTTTDYLPSHSEELTISTVKGSTITVAEKVKWDHVGHRYDVAKGLTNASSTFKNAGMDPELQKSAETRAGVALLTRSIRIVSGGDFAGDYFSCANNNVPRALAHDKTKAIPVAKDHCATQRNSNYYFGGHAAFRQGFAKLQLQGVEFHQMGQGGRKAHYPVHFHMARKVPTDTYIKDSSVSESMTRWYVLHSTQGVTLQRNVGWKSIGHGYYLEDGTETDNKFYANIGISARGAVVGPENPRNVPGILAQNGSEAAFTYRSDVVYPTVFWITNGWNDFVGNMAAGAGTCGTSFWFVPAGNTDMVEVSPKMKHMKWSGYAGRQTAGHEGDTPVKLFYKNYASTSMHSLNTSDGVSNCVGVRFVTENYPNDIRLAPVKSIAPEPAKSPNPEMYYPSLKGNRYPTVCDPSADNTATNACTGPWDEAAGRNNNDAPNVVKRCSNDDPKDCGITVIDHYTSSFHWAETNFSAIWLRTPGWLLLDNSFISDAQNGGVTFVTGGDYSRSSTALGYWGLVQHSVFVGATNPSSKFAAASGPSPVGPGDSNACDRGRGNVCISFQGSVAYPLSNWGTGQRLFNIYDGPAHQDNNAYLNISESSCNDAATCMYFGTPGVRKHLSGVNKGYLPNAAIGWKQPNGFYYPPAFHSKNLYFNNVAIRHYVIQPLFEPGTYQTKDKQVEEEFIGGVEQQHNKFSGFTDIDRQTELNDDDGTLTGFNNTISVNEDGFFGAPLQAPQCKSNVGVDPAVACAGKVSTTPQTARTSPYDYVSTVVYPGCATKVAGVGDTPFEAANKDDLRPFGACGSETAPDHPADDKQAGARFDKNQFRGGTWSRDCAGPYCYGVPIYRQYLTGKKGKDASSSTREWLTWYNNKCDPPTDGNGVVKPECNFPFARMAGASEWQRSLMTVNNGKFYIDTTAKQETQQISPALGRKDNAFEDYVECSQRPTGGNCSKRSVNLFEKDKTYLVFFLFAKKDTKQVYQIYVGKDFKPDTGFKGVKITDTNLRFKYVDWTTPWKAEMVEGSTKGVKDILQVTVDFSQVTGIELDPKKATSATCKPASFCQWGLAQLGGSGTCRTSLKDNDPRVLINPALKTIAEKVCGEWAVKDLDYPAGGALGFRFTLPGTFAADDKYHRPLPEAIPDNDTVWSKFSLKGVSAGDCTYTDANTPGKGSCGVPDCANAMGNPPFCDKPASK